MSFSHSLHSNNWPYGMVEIVFQFFPIVLTWATGAKATDGAMAFLESLHPEGPYASRKAERYNNTDVLRKRLNGSWSTLGLDEWYIAYGRARCTLDYLADQKNARRRSASDCDDPPVRASLAR
jgi:hypothetical protein